MVRPTFKIPPCWILLLVAAGSPASDEVAVERLTGSWACESGACPDEEIAFSVEDGIQAYNSWLHARPSAVDGRWSLEGNRLKIECCAGLEFEYSVIRVTDRELLLRDAAEDQEAALTRTSSGAAGQ